jgi:hypothetical protein
LRRSENEGGVDRASDRWRTGKKEHERDEWTRGNGGSRRKAGHGVLEGRKRKGWKGRKWMMRRWRLGKGLGMSVSESEGCGSEEVERKVEAGVR